jgi:MFS family permease
MLVTIGTGFSGGVLVLPLVRDLSLDQGTASAMFSLTVMAFFLLGAPMGMLADRIGARAVVGVGAVAGGAGLALTATAHSAPALFLGHGLLLGLAMACTFVPLSALVSAAFERRRALAVGIAVSGIGVGTLVMAPLIAAGIRVLGWRDTYLVLAGVVSVALVLVALFIQGVRHVPPPGRAPRGTVRSADYRRFYLAQVLVSVAIFTPFTHLPALAESRGVEALAAASLVGVVGGASVVGRLALGPVAERAGLFVTYRACYVAIAVSFLPWLWHDAGYGALLVHAVVMGAGYGGFVALLPAVVARRFGIAGLGGLLGILYTSHVLGAGLGPAGTGLLVEEHGYLPAGVLAAVCAAVGAAALPRADRGDRSGSHATSPRRRRA